MKPVVASLLLAPLLLTGCDTSNYAFKIDKSIDIVEPTAREKVSLPVELRWTDERPPALPKVSVSDATAHYYAVFLDRAPVAAGKSIASLIPSDEQCRPSQGCPTAQRLADLRVFLSAKPQLVVEFLRDLRPTTKGDTKDVHEVTIVRMRGDKRVGEAAFRQTFIVRR
jgi:hypothetical protein